MPITNYIWDEVDDVVMAETDENGDVTVEYTHEPGYHGQLISQNRGGVESFYHYDGEGNTRALTDINGNVTDRYDYNASGEVISHTGNTTNPFGFKGVLGYYANPETNDYYVRARNYEPTIARWLSADPIGFVDGMNLYLYVGNDPVNKVDPSGWACIPERCCCCVEKLEIDCSKNFVINPPDRWPLNDKVVTGYIGHRFNVSMTYKNIVVPDYQGTDECIVGWYETANMDIPELGLINDIPKNWMYDETAEGLDGFRFRSTECPLKSNRVSDRDTPAAEVIRGRKIQANFLRIIKFAIPAYGSLSARCQTACGGPNFGEIELTQRLNWKAGKWLDQKDAFYITALRGVATSNKCPIAPAKKK